MTPEQAIQEASRGELRPIYLVVGEERLLADQVLGALREAATRGGIPGFNDDKFTAGEASADSIISAARMLPMMAQRRLVVVRGLERWDARASRSDDDDDAASAEPARGVKEAGPLDRLAEYAKDPVPSTVLVLLAAKLHGQRRIATAAKKGGFWVGCDPLPRRELAGWIERGARARGHELPGEVADLLAEISGPDLACVDDALERLSLYVGPGAPITEDAVAKIVTRVRQSTVWELIDALGRRRLDRALSALADAYDPKSGGLPQLGAIAWSVRQLVKFESGLRSGLSPGDAAARAGAPPFRGGELAQTVRTIGKGTLERWLALLAEADLALKGSKRPAHAVLESMLVEMCRSPA
jgi:DNA polymerase-3 subunit delta